MGLAEESEEGEESAGLAENGIAPVSDVLFGLNSVVNLSVALKDRRSETVECFRGQGGVKKARRAA